ncbi:retrovirus-related pol polyprotein from transposon TNT 1-94 [Tanacetum coccineum]|uniref:Retrovirus-related pol polyprotein from transposon TNT 1-94 n=1 Tax=Tanacetum coccineum TaxID=301880 RepID=A0ABQ5BA26_9ASTR
MWSHATSDATSACGSHVSLCGSATSADWVPLAYVAATSAADGTNNVCLSTHHKARLVAQGYSQEERIDYDETFTPVARMEAIRIFLVYATYMNFKVFQMGVKSAFLNGKLKEEVYVKQPLGFENSEVPDYVYKLDKTLYRLKQTPRAEHGRMILESVKHGPLIWPTIEENGVTRTKKYEELSATEKIQADCDLKATNIILQGLPFDVYSIVNHHRVAKDLWERIQLLMQVNQQTHLGEFPQIDSGLAVLVFKQGDDPIDAINKMMSFMSTVVTSRFPTTNNQLRNSSNPRQQATIHDGRVIFQPVQGRQSSFAVGTSGTRANISGAGGNNSVEAQGSGKVLNEEELAFLADPRVAEGPVTQTVITHNAAYQADDLDAYDSECDDFSTTKAVFMANLSSYGSDVLSEYMLETQNAAVQDINSFAQQDGMILFMFEQLSNQVTNCNKFNRDNLIANESLSAKLERYKERVKLLKERQNVDLSTREKLIMDDIIQEKNAQFTDFEKEINSLKQTLSEQLKEKELLTETFNVLKNKSKEKETKNIDKEIAWEKKKAQHIRPMLYDGSVIAKETNVISIADLEETLMLEEESRSKMLLKQSDPIVLEKKVNIKPINYAELNRLSEDFGKSFVPQQELSDEQAFRLQTSHPNTDQSASSPVNIEAPRELPKMEAAVQQYFVDKQWFEIQKKQFFIDNDRLLDQIISQDIVNIVVNSFVNMNDSVNYVENCNKCLELEAELIKQHNMVEKDKYNRLSKSFSKLEQHCISLELAMQLNKEIFQKNNTSMNQTEPTFDHLFELNNLKADPQAKDTTIEKLKANIKCLNKTSTTNCMKKDIDEIESINIELEHRMAKLITENEHLKQIYKQVYDSIKPSCVRAKEHAESLVNQLNQKSVEITDLNAQLLEKVFVITALKNDLRKLIEKDIVDNVAQVSNATTVAPGLYKLDPVTLAPKDKNNRETHIYYLKHTMEQAAILREIVEQAKSLNPLDSASYSACKYVKLIQELLGYVRHTCSDIHKPSKKLVAITPINKKKTVRITATNKVPFKEHNPLEVVAQEYVVTKVYTRRPKVVQIVLWYLDSGCSKHMTRDRSQLTNFVHKFLGTVKFGNDQIAKIMGYGHDQIGNITISRVYYVEGLGHNIFSVGQFCDSVLEVAFRKHTCFVRNLEGVDLLSGSRETNLYALSFRDMMASSPICLLSKASKTKYWLWH